jgi:hypothetical protein
VELHRTEIERKADGDRFFNDVASATHPRDVQR